MDIENITFYFKDVRVGLWKTIKDEKRRKVVEYVLELRGFKLYSNSITIDSQYMTPEEAQKYYEDTITILMEILDLIEKDIHGINVVKP